ncbi:hypothetical protein ACO1O0_001753 [Amphichorda felina]
MPSSSPRPAKQLKTATPRKDDESPGFAWTMCHGRSIEERISLKEHAVESAELHTSRLCELLRKYAQDDCTPGAESLQSWIHHVDEVKQEHRKFEVLVGVAGPTGAGKTSLLNAILDKYELLPSGHEQAATAVSCKISWNFEAQIVQTLKAIVTQETINHTPYESEDQRIDDRAIAAFDVKEGMHKMLAVWPVNEDEMTSLALKCHQENSEYALEAEKILRSNRAVVELLSSGVKKVYESTTGALGKHIKPYLDSTTATHGGGEEFAAWPLIKNVELYIQSEVLRTGICLVDLPGAGDNVESRAKIAQDYMENLEVTMIVAGIHRAVNEQLTQKLMNDHQEMRMQMNTGYNRHSYGVVLSKMDEIDFAAYVKANKDAARNAFVQHHQGVIHEASNMSRGIEVRKKAHEKINKRNKTKVNRIKKKLEKQKKKTKSGEAVNLEDELRTAETELEDGEKLIQNLSKDQAAQEQAIERSKTHLHHWAVNKRNSSVGDRMQEDFERRQRRLARSQQSYSQEDLQAGGCLDVLSSSSKAYWQIKNDNRPMPAFPTERYTGVPRVIQWIYRATAERREERLNYTLQSYLGSIQALDNWCKTVNGDVVIDLSPAKIEGAMKNESESLRQRELLQFHGVVSKVNPFGHPDVPKSMFRRCAKPIANAWSLKFPNDEACNKRLHSKTYLAIVRRKGGPFTSQATPGQEYNWIPKLVRPMISVMAAPWNRKLHIELPGMWGPRNKAVRDILEDYFNKVTAAAGDIETSLPSYLADVKKPVLGADRIAAKVEKILSAFRKNSNAIRPAIESITQSMGHGFSEAEEVIGIGSYAKRREILEQHVEKYAPRYFDLAWAAMKLDMAMKGEQMKQHLTSIAQEVASACHVHVSLLIHRLLGTPDKLTIQSRVQSVLGEWRSDWQCPSGSGSHILGKDVSIPQQLRAEDLDTIKQEDDSDSESEGDSDDNDSMGIDQE